jgi:hypothetical protein
MYVSCPEVGIWPPKRWEIESGHIRISSWVQEYSLVVATAVSACLCHFEMSPGLKSGIGVRELISTLSNERRREGS